MSGLLQFLLSPMGQWVFLALAITVLILGMLPSRIGFGMSARRRSKDLQELVIDAHTLHREFQLRFRHYPEHHYVMFPFQRIGIPDLKDVNTLSTFRREKDELQREVDAYRLTIFWNAHLDDHLELLKAFLNAPGIYSWLLRKSSGGFELLNKIRDGNVSGELCLHILKEHESKLRNLT